MAKTFRPTDSDELRRDLESASPRDTIIMKPGIYYLDRIYSFDHLNIFGGDDDATKTVIRPLEGRAFRDQGGSVFQNFSAQGGAYILEAEGHNTTIKNFISWGAIIPVKLSGDDHLFDGGLLYDAGRTGIEVNGGYYLIPELSDKPFKLKKEVGLLSGQNPSQEWTAVQKQRFEDLFYHRQMDVVIANVVGIRCGYRGGMTYGAFIKCVPNAGGVYIHDNVGIENVNDYWNDFPSDQPFYIHDNIAVRTVAHSIFVEGYIRDTAKADIYNNIVVGADRPLFVSAFPEARSWGNLFFFDDYGKVVHGITGNREEKSVGCITPEGNYPDKLIALDPRFYRAHQVAATEANYDFSIDELYTVHPLDIGPLRSESPGNAYGPFEEIQNVEVWDVPIPDWEDIAYHIDDRYLLPEVLGVLKQETVFIDNPDNPDPVIVPPPANSDDLPHVWLFSDNNDLDDQGALSVDMLGAAGNYIIKGITVGCQPNKMEDPLYVNPVDKLKARHVKAWLAERENLGCNYDFEVRQAMTYMSNFNNYGGPPVDYIDLTDYTPENPLYLCSGAPNTEVAAIIKDIKMRNIDLKKVVIISHFSADPTENNYKRDKAAMEYLKSMVRDFGLQFIELDRFGADLWDRNAATGELSPDVLKSQIGQYIGDKWVETSLDQPGRPDASDSVRTLIFNKDLFGDFLQRAKRDGSSNLALLHELSPGKQAVYTFVEERAALAINGGNGNPDPNPPSDLLIKVDKLILKQDKLLSDLTDLLYEAQNQRADLEALKYALH